MASTQQSMTIRGLGVVDTRWSPATISAADSAYTQGGPRAAGVGIPANSATAAVVTAQGDQDTSIVVTALQGGLPRAGRGARFAYRFATEPTSKLRGWQPPNVITGVTSPGYAVAAQDSYSAVTLRTGDILAVRRSSGFMVLRQYSPDTAAWSVLTAPVTSCGEGIAIAIDSAGYILILCSAGSTGQWTLYRSIAADNPSAGWAEISRNQFLPTDPQLVDRMRLFVMANGDLCLLAQSTGAFGAVAQFASSDGGTSFTLVQADFGGSAAADLMVGDAVLTPSGYVGFANVDDGSTTATFYRSSNPWQPLLATTGVVITANAREVWLASDPSGRVYAFFRPATDFDRIFVTYSDDDGASWNPLLAGLTDQAGDVAQYMSDGAATFSMGSVYLLAASVDAVGAYDQSLIMLRCGGFSNVVLQEYGTNDEQNFRGSGYTNPLASGSWTGGATWYPVGEPDTLSCWTATGLTAADAFNVDGKLVITTSAAVRWFGLTGPATGKTFQILEGEFAVKAGGSTTTAAVAITSRLSNGANGTEINVYASSTGFTVRNSTTTLATISVSMTTPMQFRIFHRLQSSAEVYYRRPWETTWTLAYSSAALTSIAAAAGYTQWGHQIASTSTSAWSYFWTRLGSPAGIQGVIGSPLSALTGFEYMLGHPLTGLGTAIGERAAATAGERTRLTRISATDGPAVRGDQWTLAPTYDYPIENLFPMVEPGPRKTWRSAGQNTTESIAFALDGVNDTSLGRSYGFALINTNIRSVGLLGWNGTSWVAVTSVDLATGLIGLYFTRVGNVLRIAGTADAARYINRNELIGATVAFSASVQRKILRHTEGIWSDAAGKHVEIVLAGIDGSEPTSGQINIRVKSGVVVVHGDANLYDKWLISIPPQYTAEGYYEIGNLVVFQIVAFGMEPSWGGVQSYAPNASKTTTEDDVSRVRRRGPVARTWTWGWSDAVDLTGLRGSPPTPDYIATSVTTEGIANVFDVAYLLSGVLEELQSGAVPVVAFEWMPFASGVLGTLLIDPTLWMYGRLTSGIGIEHIQGDFERDAVVRVSPITIEELV